MLNSIETPSEDEPEAKKTKASRKKTVEPKTEGMSAAEATLEEEHEDGELLVNNGGEDEV